MIIYSLGGGLAAAASLATDKEAITFNPAALSSMTKNKYGLETNEAKITNYVLAGKSKWWGGDPLYQFQRFVGMKLEGTTIMVPSNSYKFSHNLDKMTDFLRNLK